MSPRVVRACALVLLAAIPVIASWPEVSGWLMTDPVYTASRLGTDFVAGPLPGRVSQDPNDGTTTEALGRLAASEWLHGRVPWWNPYDGVGLPLAAEGANQALFLPFVLLFALRHGSLWLLLVLQEITAFATYALLRRMALARLAAWIGAALYSLNSTFAWLPLGPMMPIAFAPLLLLGVEMEWNAIRRPPGARMSLGWVVVAVAIALSLYAGFPETAYLDALLAVAWSLLRIAQCAAMDRLRFTVRVGAGGLVGLLMAAPFVVPFLHLLKVGEIGPHAAGLGTFAIPLARLSMLLMPHVLGPQLVRSFDANDPTYELFWVWMGAGGYITAGAGLLAVIALLTRHARERALRWVLAAWCVAMIGASFGVPGIRWAVYSVPVLAQVIVSRYATPSWELAVIVLAALAIDDWQRAGALRCRAIVAAALVVGAGAAALAAASATIAYLWTGTPDYPPWLLLSVGEAAAVVLGIAALIGARPVAWRGALLAFLLAGESAMMFSVTRLAGLRHAEMDMGPVNFLQQHLGLQREYSFGTMVPNYPAYFQVASINSYYLPVPQIWAEYIRNSLYPGRNASSLQTISIYFTGWGDEDVFRASLAAYRELGVRYLLVPTGDTLGPSVRTSAAHGAEAATLPPGADLEVTLPASSIHAGSIASVSLMAGTYGGAIDGALSIIACAGDTCRSGTSNLARTGNNAPLEIYLREPLPIDNGQDLRLRFTKADGTSALTIWRFDQVWGGRAPGMTIEYAVAGVERQPVYADPLVRIYELSDVLPYFETSGGPCGLSAATRESVTTECAAPARLIRRELFFDGWQASINGKSEPIIRASPIFQGVDVPAGTARVRFHYAPPFAAASAAAMITGLLIVLAGAAISWKGPRARARATDEPSGRPP